MPYKPNPPPITNSIDLTISQHPHLSPAETWRHLFDKDQVTSDSGDLSGTEEIKDFTNLFTPSTKPAHLEILRLLAENEPDTISIVAVGPLTNLAMAATVDPKTFLRAKEVIVMGGTLDCPGNVGIWTLLPSLSSHVDPKAHNTSLSQKLNE